MLQSNTTWLTADLHFGHKRILELRSKFHTFDDLEGMDSYIIESINSKVKVNDTLIILGDLSFRKLHETVELMQRIRCKNILLRGGNHDKELLKPSKREVLIQQVPSLQLIETDLCIPVIHNGNREHFVVSHFPFQIWDRKHYGSYHFHGHCHGFLEQEPIRRMDVGMDTTTDLSPLLMSDVMERLKLLENA